MKRYARLVLILCVGVFATAQDWVPSSLSDPATRGLIAGKEADGSPVYVIRAPFQGGLTLGKYIPKSKAAYVPWGGKENPVKTFELFVGTGRWVAMSKGDQLPPGSVAGGNEADGSPLYIIRAPSGKAVVPGKYSELTGQAYIPFGGKEVEVTQFEVLVANPRATAPASPPPPATVPMSADWVSADVNFDPHGMIAAGVSPDGTPSYLIRAPFQGDLVPGKFNPKAKTAYVPWGGKENPVKTFELYVGTGNWVPFNAGAAIPPDAVLAGKQADGTPLLAIRAPNGNALIPGKYSPQTKMATFSFGGKEVIAPKFEILVRAKAVPGQVAPPPAPSPVPGMAPDAGQASGGDQDALFHALVDEHSPLLRTPLVPQGGAAQITGDLGAGDYQWGGRSVDAYEIKLNEGDTLQVALSSPTAKPGDFELFLFDSHENMIADLAQDGNVSRLYAEADYDGTYYFVVTQKTQAGRARYGANLQMTAFSIEGDLQGIMGVDDESDVPVVWNPAYTWTLTIQGDFDAQFELIDSQGKTFARLNNGVSVSVVPPGRGTGKVKIFARTPGGDPHWKLSFRLTTAGGK